MKRWTAAVLLLVGVCSTAVGLAVDGKKAVYVGGTRSDIKEAAVFEPGKDIVRTTLVILEARTGKKIQYQDDEARKSGTGGH